MNGYLRPLLTEVISIVEECEPKSDNWRSTLPEIISNCLTELHDSAYDRPYRSFADYILEFIESSQPSNPNWHELSREHLARMWPPIPEGRQCTGFIEYVLIRCWAIERKFEEHMTTWHGTAERQGAVRSNNKRRI